MLGEENAEVLIEFEYLGMVYCKYESMKGELRERELKGRLVRGALLAVMKARGEHGNK